MASAELALAVWIIRFAAKAVWPWPANTVFPVGLGIYFPNCDMGANRFSAFLLIQGQS